MRRLMILTIILFKLAQKDNTHSKPIAIKTVKQIIHKSPIQDYPF